MFATRNFWSFLLSLPLSWAAIGPAAAQSPVINGQLDADFYGAPLAVQDTPTSFGNATNGHTRVAVGGSELDAAYARVSDGYLYLFIAGNLETMGVGGIQWPAGNQNKLDLFVDCIPGGQNSLRGDNVEIDGGALGSMGHLDPANDGLKFDTGFEADFYLTFYNQTRAVPWFDPPQVEAWRGLVYYATLPTGGGGTSQILGVAEDSNHQTFTPTFTFTNGVQLGFNNSNTSGVYGTGDANESNTSLASNVTTGLELAIPVELFAAADGSINETIRICAFINNVNHRSMSNQVLGPMSQSPGGYGNLNDPRLFNFSESYSPGDQFFSAANPYASARDLLVPEAASGGVLTHRWLGSIGHSYALQVATNLLGPQVWTTVSGPLTATVPVVSATVTSAAPVNVYRARRLD